MINNLIICNAAETDSDELTTISFAAKRYWNYPEHYYELWKNELTITSEYIKNNKVFKALYSNAPVGYYSLVKNDKDFYAGEVLVKQGYYLEHIFILPMYHKKGIGSAMVGHMKQFVTSMSVNNVLVFADPYSRGFYDKTGAEFLYDSKSSIPGRMIPVYQYVLNMLIDQMDSIKKTINFKIIQIFAFLFISGTVYSQCKLNPPDSLYQSAGIYSVVCDSIESKRDKDDVQVYIFRPLEKTDKSPVVILCHQFGNRSPENYNSIINSLVSKGTIVIYPSSVIVSAENDRENKFRSTFSSIDTAVHTVYRYIDSSRIGIVAHGFGGGVAPSLLYKMINDRKWGLNGAFMYIASPWYMNTMDLRQMVNFPDFVNIIVQVFDNDVVNDPDIAVDIFNNLNVSADNKRFIVMRSDKRDRCELKASFSIPEGSITSGASNFLDIYGINRIIDSLNAYSLFRDSTGFNFLYKKKGVNEIPMGTWSDGSYIKTMLITDSAYSGIIKKKLMYVNPWRSLRNARLDQRGNRYTREISQQYRKKTRESITTFIRTQIRKDREDSTSTGLMENPIINSFGADGPYTMQADTVNNPYVSNEQFSKSMPVYFFTPVGRTTPSPVIIFIHGYIGQNPDEFEPLLRHIVSLGYTIIYPSYSFLPKADTPGKVLDKYGYLYSGIEKAARILSWRIDTTRVGFFGQSFGAGAIPAITYKLVNEKKWGKNGVFLFITAPWYSFDITEEQIKKFPSTAKLLMQVYDDDQINDHAMAVDLFNALPIPASEKDYMTMYSDSLDGYVMQANHFVPYGPENIYGDLNALDYYGIYKNFDALADYTFTGNMVAKNIALGNGSVDQVYMGMWSENKPVKIATVTDTPKPMHPELNYLYSWDNELNPRKINKTSKIRK